MKNIIFFFLTAWGLFGTPTVCLNMIVKNESKVIERCLGSVKPFIDYWVIVDTGSTDGTQEIIQKFMGDVPGELYERPWVNFSYNRNEALQLAKSKGDYLFFIDADDILSYSPDFKRPFLDQDGYFMTILYNGVTYSRTQLIKSKLDWRWEGVIHEVLTCPEAANMGALKGINMVILGGGGRSDDPEKYLKDARLLENALLNDPMNGRYTFYLAQSYRDAQMPELALKYYEDRVALQGWDQEVFWSLYEIAQLQEALNFPHEEIVESYIKAFQYRPTRSEPLYRLAEYYRKNENYFLGYLVSKQGLEIPQPSDLLFVESWIYEYGLLLEFSICSYWIGKYEESFQACIQLLTNDQLPRHITQCVQRNLKFTLDKLPPGLSGYQKIY